jgi:antitoxin component HigA of HigAB toxin-antitoxin module
MTPKPIRTEDDYQRAMAEVDYETKALRNSALDPIGVIKAEMEMNGRTRTDLAALVGESRASEILARKRTLSLNMIRKISTAWEIPADLLIGDYAAA